MKKPIIIYLILVLTCISCVDSTEKYERDLNDLLGQWNLQEMTYTDESEKSIVYKDVSSSIIFTNTSVSLAEGNIDRKGTLIIEDDSINFNYQFDFSQNTINIEIEQDLIRSKPLYTFGKMQGNDFELIDENKILFYSEFEYVYPSNEILTNPVYVFVR
ncbi:MAG TPA: hypothetical protein VJY41_07285 [Prolixibacteraceae bacterium]|nr:hypothetical protein [Prolixibacteraceae bacterium]